MKIYLPYTPHVNDSWRYAGNNKRQATATAVRFVGENLLVAHYLGRKLYLLDKTGKVLSSIDTEYETDLLDYKDNLIACSNLFNEKISLFSLTDKLSFYKYLTVPHDHLHGIFIDKDSVLCTTGHSIVRVDYESNCTIIKTFEDQPKDVFIYGDYMVVVSTKGFITTKPGKIPKKATTIHLIKENITLDTISIDGQVDAVTYKDDNPFVIYLTSQDINAVAKVILENEKLKFEKYISGFSFPHGIHYANNKLAVSNYGDNSISILDV